MKQSGLKTVYFLNMALLMPFYSFLLFHVVALKDSGLDVILDLFYRTCYERPKRLMMCLRIN